MKLKRDITSQTAPAPSQIEVGDLYVNANTGILYSKRTDGTVIKWLGIPVCDPVTNIGGYPVPVIKFSDTSVFCCGGTALTVTVNNLLVDYRYKLNITELSSNVGVLISEFNTQLLPLNTSDRSIILNITIPRVKPSAIFKFGVYQIDTVGGVDVDTIKSEQILVITCKEC
jgi:hypothetical protein